MVELDLNERYEQNGQTQREIGEFVYATESWDMPCRVATRL